MRRSLHEQEVQACVAGPHLNLFAPLKDGIGRYILIIKLEVILCPS